MQSSTSPLPTRLRTRFWQASLVLAVLLLLGWPEPARAVRGGPDRIYFPQTGHSLAFGFLDFWLAHGDTLLFGYPLSEELDEGGLTVQYFERAVFEWHPEAPAEWRVQLRRLGAETTRGRSDRAFRPTPPIELTACRYFPETQHNLCSGFRAFWERHGGLRIFGYPISEELSEDGLTVQYFERARLEWHPEARGTHDEIQVTPLGAWAADRIGTARDPLPQPPGVAVFDPERFPGAPALVRTPPAGAPVQETKWIEVDLSQQALRAWEGDRLVFSTLVSTGLPQYPTPWARSGYTSRCATSGCVAARPGSTTMICPMSRTRCISTAAMRCMARTGTTTSATR
jgi:hypothetical protein